MSETYEQAEARWAAARARLNYVPEMRDEQVARMERDGLMDPACPMCQDEYYSRPDTMPCDVFAPRHQASTRCQSGKRAHCTCDTCF
jgi:hypothetical protein